MIVDIYLHSESAVINGCKTYPNPINVVTSNFMYIIIKSLKTVNTMILI